MDRTRGTQVLASPDGSHDLARGVIVETDIVARLFGVRALRLTGDVVIVPADVRDLAPPERSRTELPVPSGSSRWAPDLPARSASTVIAHPASTRGSGSRRTLADAVQLVAESEQTLRALRR